MLVKVWQTLLWGYISFAGSVLSNALGLERPLGVPKQRVTKLAQELPKVGMLTPRKRRGARGQTLVEYALLIALVAVATIGALVAFSGGVQKNFGDSDSALQKAFSGN